MGHLIKTTIEIPDGLFVAAKKRAAETRRPLRALVEAGLRSQLAAAPAKRHGRIRWVTVDAGVPAGLVLRDREAMHDWLRRHRQ